MQEKIYILPPVNGFQRVSHPQLVDARSAAWDYCDKTCSRWKPSRVTISGEAVNLLLVAAAEYDMTPRAMLEAMMHHGFSGINRPGSWEAATPFNPYSYGDGENCVADRWFR